MSKTNLPTSEAMWAALDSADFPSDKTHLIRAAESTNPDEAVIATLRSLPVEVYANRDEVLRSIETAEATGTTPSEHAAQARQPADPGLAQHQRTTGPA
jgi:hypothetical protein